MTLSFSSLLRHDLVSTSRTRSVGWLMTHAGPIAGAGSLFQLSRRATCDGALEEYLPVGPCERHGELGRENVVFLRPVRQTGEVTGVARRGCGRFLRRGVGDHFAARQLAAVGRNILLRRQRAAREECYDRKNTPHIFAFLTFIFAARRNEFLCSAPA